MNISCLSIVSVSPHLYDMCIFRALLHKSVPCWHVESMAVGIIGMFFVGIESTREVPMKAAYVLKKWLLSDVDN